MKLWTLSGTIGTLRLLIPPATSISEELAKGEENRGLEEKIKEKKK